MRTIRVIWWLFSPIEGIAHGPGAEFTTEDTGLVAFWVAMGMAEDITV